MVSIVIPAYNVEKYIGDCLDSVLAQKGVDMEIIVVNDGSTDSTVATVDAYASMHRIITAVSRPNGGPSAARNTALPYCRGEWIAMVDGDDIMAPGALRKMLDVAMRHDEVDIVFGRYIPFQGDWISFPKSASSQPMFLSGREAAEMMLYQKKNTYRVNPSAWGKLYRREFWHDTSFSEDLIYEDLQLMPRRCASTRRIAVIDDPVYGYRINADSLLHTFSEKRMDAIKATSQLCEFFAGDKTLYKAARSRHFSAAFNLWLLIKANDADMPGHLSECRRIVRNLAVSQLFGRKVRARNRIGALLQYFPFIFKSSYICKKLLAK